MVKNLCVIVDPVSTGAYFAPAFNAFGIKSIAVRTAQYSPNMGKTFIESNFARVVDYDGDMDRLVQALGDTGRILFTIAGSDRGITVSDALNRELGLPMSNDPALSAVRQDKFLMIEQIARAGLRAPRQFVSSEIDAIVSWASDTCGFPVVVKPCRSAAVDGVRICETAAELRAGCEAIMGKHNLYGRLNDTAVVQSYTSGQEYMIDTVSCDGVHKLVSIWKVSRAKGPFPFAYRTDLLPFDAPESARLTDYVFSVLDACGVRYGPVHTEVIVEADGSPVLVEINARPHGTLDIRLPSVTVGTNQIIETAYAYCDPLQFAATRLHGERETRGHCMKAYLVSDVAGDIRQPVSWQAFEALDSFAGIYPRLKSGGLLKQTRDLASSPGVVYLAGPSREAVEADYQRLREIESSGFYKTLL